MACVKIKVTERLLKNLRTAHKYYHLEVKEMFPQHCINSVKHKNKHSFVFQHDAMLIKVAEYYVVLTGVKK